MHNRMENEITEAEFDKEFAEGKPVKVRVNLKGSILSVRMDRALLYRLDEYAKAQGIGITTAARQLIEEGLYLDTHRTDGLANVLERVAGKLRESDAQPPPVRPSRTRKGTAPKPKAGKL